MFQSQLRSRPRSKVAAAFGATLFAFVMLCGSASAELRLQIPEQTFGPPFYARIEFASVDAGIVPNNGEWAAIVLYRQLDCIPGDFNLLTVFDVPRAFSCPLNDIGGYEVWANAPGADPAPAYSRLIGRSQVPVLFVRHAEFLGAIADGVLTLPELRALPSARIGRAGYYNELLRPSQSNANPLLHITAHGRFEDGSGFRLRWTLSRPPGSAGNVARTRIELIGVNAPLGATLQPAPFGGMWFDPAKPGQGVTLLPVPGEDRLVGTWNTYAGGKPVWYLIDTGNNGFDGLRAIFDVFQSSGGVLNQAQPVSMLGVGRLQIDLSDCNRANAKVNLGTDSSVMSLQSLVAAESCFD